MKDIETLRKFFRISNAAFTFSDAVVSAFGGIPITNKMRALHSLALNEVEKDCPDMDLISILLKEMEQMAEKNAKS